MYEVLVVFAFSDTAVLRWIGGQHGGSFVAPQAIRDLRDLTRYRKRLVQEHTSECQRVQKMLEDAGIKLDSVASDVPGVSGRAMLQALVAGERDPKVLAEWSKGVLRKKIPLLRQALHGRFKEHHGLLIGLCLEHIAYLEGAIAKLDSSRCQWMVRALDVRLPGAPPRPGRESGRDTRARASLKRNLPGRIVRLRRLNMLVLCGSRQRSHTRAIGR